jgi:hypothetical protein
MTDNDKGAQLAKRLLETTQDIFIFQSLQTGLSGEVIKGAADRYRSHHAGIEADSEKEEG